MKTLIGTFIIFFVVLIAAEFELKRLLTQRLLIGDASFITVERGETASGFVNKLVKRGIIKESMLYRVMYKRYPALMRFKAGTYQVEAGESFRQLLAKITQGKGHLFRITLIEGETLDQFIAKLRRHDRLKHLFSETNAAQQLADLIGVDHAEGWLFPETYYFVEGTTDKAIVQMAHTKMKDMLTNLWDDNENPELSSSYQGLILASIIEKETGLSRERKIISSVFTNRLRKNMRLQTDPTVIYGIGPDFNGNITRKDLRTDTEYNTYTRKGLPPTPIAMPGLESLKAAFSPDDTEYLYFVGKGDGSHEFSKTYDAHKRAVRQYQLKK